MRKHQMCNPFHKDKKSVVENIKRKLINLSPNYYPLGITSKSPLNISDCIKSIKCKSPCPRQISKEKITGNTFRRIQCTISRLKKKTQGMPMMFSPRRYFSPEKYNEIQERIESYFKMRKPYIQDNERIGTVQIETTKRLPKISKSKKRKDKKKIIEKLLKKRDPAIYSKNKEDVIINDVPLIRNQIRKEDTLNSEKQTTISLSNLDNDQKKVKEKKPDSDRKRLFYQRNNTALLNESSRINSNVEITFGLLSPDSKSKDLSFKFPTDLKKPSKFRTMYRRQNEIRESDSISDY